MKDRNKKGQIAIGTMLTIGSMIAGAVMWIQGSVSSVSERTARLETDMPTMKEDIKEIKSSLKKIEGALRIPQEQTIDW